MRTDEEILNSQIFPGPDFYDTDGSTRKKVLSAMKEAKEEYAKAFFLWVQTVRDDNGHDLEHRDIDLFFWSCDHDGENPMNTEDLMKMFNAHLAAEAEKERGKNGQ